MSLAAIDPVGPFRPTDRSFFLLVLAAIWGGLLAGFVPDSLEHLAGKHLAFAPIVHLHAVVFAGWMVLLTQVVIALVYINPAWPPIATHLLGH